MKLTHEQKKAAIEGFQKHDFTKDISLVLPDMTDEDEQEAREEQFLKTVSPLVDLVKGYMKDDTFESKCCHSNIHFMRGFAAWAVLLPCWPQ